MPTISFTTALQRFLPTPTADVSGDTVGAALDQVFATQPALRGYILDDQGALRRHVNVYVNGQPVHDRTRLSDALQSDDDVYVAQALTGG